ncbi:MAG: hypothetical protein AB1483_05920 [Candidatus Zixiibacteriota bacterium]
MSNQINEERRQRPRHRRIALPLWVVLLVATTLTYTLGDDKPEVVANEDEAIARALIFTGFDKLKGYPGDALPEAMRTSVTDDSTPHVGNIINSREIWRVKLPGVHLSAIRPVDRDSEATFYIFIDPEDGALLKVYSMFVDTAYSDPGTQPIEPVIPIKVPLITGDTATVLTSSGSPEYGERESLFGEFGFEGLPDTMPAKFLDVMRHSGPNMARAISLEAVYINQRQDDSGKAAPVWITWLHGYPCNILDDTRGLLPEDTTVPRKTRRWLFNKAITSDGLTGECLKVQESGWATGTGKLTDFGYRFTHLAGETKSMDAFYVEDRSQLSVQTDVNVKLLVTDPLGRRTGTDPVSGESYEEIPRADYDYEAIGSRMGPGRLESRRFTASKPFDGEYRLTVVGVNGDERRHYVSILCYDLSNGRWDRDLGRIAPGIGETHSYCLRFDRIDAANCLAWGGFDGESNEAPEIDRFLSYVNISQTTVPLRSSTTEFRLIISYGQAIDPTSFRAAVNGYDITDLFSASPSGLGVVTIPLSASENTLVLSVEGETSDGKAQDIDSLIFLIQ